MRCLVQVHHVVLMNHTVLKIATFYNLLINFFKNNFVLSSSIKESIRLPILFLDLKTAQAYDNNYDFFYIKKAIGLPPGCRMNNFKPGHFWATWYFHFQRL